MSDFDRLGEEIRQQFHAAVEDLHPSAELIANVDAIPSGRGALGLFGRLGRRPGRIALALPVPIAAIVAAAVFLFGGSGVTPVSARAITVLPNGEVRVQLSELGDVNAANAVFRRHHIHNMVVVPMTASCPYQKSFTYTADPSMNRPPPPLVTLKPRGLAPGTTVVLAAKSINWHTLVTAFGSFKGQLPTCASVYGTGAGMGNITVPKQTGTK